MENHLKRYCYVGRTVQIPKIFLTSFSIRVVFTELILTIMFPIFLIILLFAFSLIYWKTFGEAGIGKKEVALLIAGSSFTMFLNFPLFVSRDYFLALNVGGALIPLALSFHLIARNSHHFLKILSGVGIVSIATYLITFVTEEGVVSYFPYYFIPSVLSVLLSLLFYYRHPKAISFSYIISTLGVIIGGDMAHLPEIFSTPFMGSMGGAGIYDMVYLAGLISICLSFLFVEKKRATAEERRRERLQREIYSVGEMMKIAGDYKDIMKEVLGEDLDAIPRNEEKKIIKRMNREVKIYADPAKRVIAFLIDFVILFPLTLLFLFLMDFRIYIIISFPILIQFVYFLFFESLFKTTVGKALLDLEVRDIYNRSAEPMAIFTRNIFRIVEFFLIFYALSILLIALTPKKQRIGDMVADTVVVEVGK